MCFSEIELESSKLTFPRSQIPVELHDKGDYIADAILLITQFEILYCIFDTPNISNEKLVNCKVVYLVEYYNFVVDFISIRYC